MYLYLIGQCHRFFCYHINTKVRLFRHCHITMLNISWEGYGRIGPDIKSFDKVKMCLFKIATSKYVKCKFKQNKQGESKDGMIHCVLLQDVKKVVMRYRDVVVFVPYESMKAKYKLKFTRTRHLIIPAFQLYHNKKAIFIATTLKKHYFMA